MAKATITSGQYYESLTLIATAAIALGDIVVINGRVLVALNTAAIGEKVAFAHEARIEAPKVAATAVGAGATMYWDATNQVFTPTVAVGLIKCGMAIAPAAAADALVQMTLTNEVNL